MKHFSELGQTAQRVVDAAEGLVQRRGYNGFSYDDVASSVGIKKPSIHHHFPTKAELVQVVAQRYTHRFRGELLRIEGETGSPRARLTAYADLFERTFAVERRLCVCGMLGAESEGLPPEVADEVENFFRVNVDWLMHTLLSARETGLLRQGLDPALTAEAFLCCLEGAMVVGRGLRGTQGPAGVARVFLSSALT